MRMRHLFLFGKVVGKLWALSSTTPAPPSGATHFGVSIPILPTSPRKGVAFNLAVSALNAAGAVDTAYAGTVHFTSNDSAAVLHADSTLTSGVGSLATTLNTVFSAILNNAKSVTATDTVTTTITGTSNSVHVLPAPATKYLVTTASTDVTAGVEFTLSVSATDASNVVDIAYSGTVHFTSTDGIASLPADTTLTSGQGQFNVVLRTDTPASNTITATDTVTTSITGVTSTLTVHDPTGFDNFADANGTDINGKSLLIDGSSGGPHVWGLGSGTWEVQSGKAVKTANDDTDEFIFWNSTLSDCTVKARVTVPDGGFAGLCVRVVDSDNLYFVNVGVGQWFLWSIDSGVPTLIDNGNASVADGVACVLQVGLSGSTISVYLRPTVSADLVLLTSSAGNTTRQTATKHGLQCKDLVSTLDDFVVY